MRESLCAHITSNSKTVIRALKNKEPIIYSSVQGLSSPCRFSEVLQLKFVVDQMNRVDKIFFSQSERSLSSIENSISNNQNWRVCNTVPLFLFGWISYGHRIHPFLHWFMSSLNHAILFSINTDFSAAKGGNSGYREEKVRGGGIGIELYFLKM